jgi:hypothetical protein
MPRIITRTIKAPKTAHHTCKNGKRVRALPAAKATAQQERQAFEAHKRREARKARAQRQVTVRSDGVTRCSKCPPKHCCPECARINNARQVAGLIRPKGDPRPHPNNCMPCIPRLNKYMGHRPEPAVKRPSCEIVSIDVTPLGGGWYEGSASLGLETIYAKKFRSRDAAHRYAVDSMVAIREGLRFEQMLLDA